MSARSDALLAWMKSRERKLRYANDRPAKLNPDSSGFSDCSGTIHAAYKTIGITIGDMSYVQAKQGIEISRGNTVAQFRGIQGSLRAGDIVAMALRAGLGGGTKINHVEMYAGNGYSWGHGSGMGPQYHDVGINWLLGNAAFWTVRRIIGSDLDPQAHNENGEEEMTPAQEAKLDVVIARLNWLTQMEQVPNQPFGYSAATHNSLGDVINKLDALKKTVEGLNSVDVKDKLHAAIDEAFRQVTITLTSK